MKRGNHFIRIYWENVLQKILSPTVPVSILDTPAKPDMVLIRVLHITLIELTIPYDSQEKLNGEISRKSNKGSYLRSDLEAKGYSYSLMISLL